MNEKDIDKTAFVTHHELFRYNRMPLGLKNAMATFQRDLPVILASAKCQCAIEYIDQLPYFSNLSPQHLRHTEVVFGLINNARMTIKLKKCHFFSENLLITSGT